MLVPSASVGPFSVFPMLYQGHAEIKNIYVSVGERDFRSIDIWEGRTERGRVEC